MSSSNFRLRREQRSAGRVTWRVLLAAMWGQRFLGSGKLCTNSVQAMFIPQKGCLRCWDVALVVLLADQYRSASRCFCPMWAQPQTVLLAH